MKTKGIDIQPKYIPADVFEKRAVEKDQVVFRVKDPATGETVEQWTGDFIFENEWQSFRTKKDRKL